MGRQVLISPYALVAVIKEEQHIAVDLTKMQIERSPSLNSDQPVSHQFEEAYKIHFSVYVPCKFDGVVKIQKTSFHITAKKG